MYAFHRKFIVMVFILIIQKDGNMKELNVRDFNTTELYKKCGFKKDTDFSCRTEWKNTSKKFTFDKVQLWAKNSGKAGTENKYDLPPPIDNELFFGSCAVVAYDNNNEPFNMHEDEWEKYYEHLFGGFEDITQNALEDENEEDELENVPDEMKTKDGYLKDGFVVDDDDDDENSELSYEDYAYSEEEY